MHDLSPTNLLLRSALEFAVGRDERTDLPMVELRLSEKEAQLASTLYGRGGVLGASFIRVYS